MPDDEVNSGDVSKAGSSTALTIVTVIVLIVAGVLVLMPRQQLHIATITTNMAEPEKTIAPPHTTTDFTSPVPKAVLAAPKPPEVVAPYVRPEIANLVTRWDRRKSIWGEPYDFAIVGYDGESVIDWLEFSELNREKPRLVAQYIVTYKSDGKGVTVAEFRTPSTVSALETEAPVTEYGDIYVGRTVYGYDPVGKLTGVEHFDQQDRRNDDLAIERAADGSIDTVSCKDAAIRTESLKYNKFRELALWDVFGQVE